MLSLALVLIVIFIFVIALKRRFSHWSRQGIKSDRFFSTSGYLEDQSQYTLKMFDKYGRVYGGYTLAYDFLVINDPELIKQVFIKHFDVFPDHLNTYIGPSPKVNQMLLFMHGDDNWRRVRSIISPAFTPSKVKEITSYINEFSDELVKTLGNLGNGAKRVDMRKYFGAFVMDVIIAYGFGLRINSTANPDHPIVLNAHKILGLDASFTMVTCMLFPSIAKFLKMNFFDINAIKVLDNLVEKMKAKRLQNKVLEQDQENKITDFIQLMLDSEITDEKSGNKCSGTLSSDELTAQCIFFLIAAYDTTLIALTHVVYHLSVNKDCQQRLYEELKDVKEFSYENLSRLKYLNAVIDESLRLSPPILRIQRQSIKDFELSAGTVVEVCPFALHRDPELWHDPLEFKPERFIEPTHDPFAYLPFGAGPRVCIGQRFALNEMRVCCAKLFSKFEFKIEPGYKPDYFKGNIVLQPKEMLLELKLR